LPSNYVQGRDRSRGAAVNLMNWLSGRKMGMSREHVIEVIKAVGNDYGKVEAYLKNGR